MKKTINNAFLLLLSVVLSACGLATPSDPIEVILDETPPSITNTTPTNNGILGYNDDTISLTLDENIAPESLSALNALEIKTTSGVTIGGSWTIDNSKNLVIFKLAQRGNIPADEQFSININGEITDEAGNLLIKTLQFRTPKLFDINISASGLDAEDNVEVTLEINGKNPTQFGITNNNTSLNIAKLTLDDTYSVRITQQATKTFCSISNTQGIAVNTDIALKCHNVIPVISDASNWNQYQNLTHGGELRRVTFQGPNSCDGLIGKDRLDAFDWQCTLEENGNLTFTSSGLKPEKQLSDLISFGTSPGWKNNQLKVLDGQSVIYETTSNIWWSNPVIVTDVNTNRVLKTKGAIYLIQAGSPLSRYYTIDENEIAFLISPTVNYSPANGENGILVNDVTRTWIEGKIFPNKTQTAIKVQSSTLTIIRNVIVQGSESNGISLENSDFTTILNSQAINNKANGIHVNNSYFVSILNSSSLNNANSGLFLSTNKATVSNFDSLHNRQSGIVITGNDNTLFNIRASNNRLDGLVIAGGDKNNINMATISSNGETGLRFTQTAGGLNNATKNLLSNITTSNNTSNGIRFDIDALHNNRLINVLDAFNDDLVCFDNGCDDVKSISGDDIALETLFSPVETNAGSIINTTYQFSQILNFSAFDNPYRAWGGVNGTCNTITLTSCKLFDWSLNVENNTYARDQFSPDTTTINTHTFSSSASVSFLSHAVEIMNDKLGNNNGNGLCEKNESCIFTPNIGSYQGHGELQELTDNENELSAQMFKYTENGR